ncbi:hypothetical protein B0A48_12459 [Cryoendolithus antarcticus]|uniref:Enoyl reductase (ER) domain-containing protein n=1 Tax=Cryoendolithus antarcticus TaxID=1507870 RepID=A0A1V8SS55_9PEZI|nr:hypothetical protein B0A48_12459 [Cryoendolithus antarcticus]
MRGIQISSYVSGPRDLKVVDLPAPTPNKSQYTIRVHTTATNFFDLLQIRGKYQHQPPLPWTAGAEFAGEVIAVPDSPSGQKKLKYNVGDRVFGAAQGGYAEVVVAIEAQLKPVPEGWSYNEAAGLFVTMPTSYAGLVTRAKVQKGEWVLVHAAAGGVGLAAVMIAKALGATVVATAGTEEKLQVAKNFGADHVINYRDADWPLKVKAMTPGQKGVNVVYDPVGLIDKSTKCTAWNGRLIVIGFVGGEIEKVAMNKLLLKNIAVMGLHWGAYALNEPETTESVWEELLAMMSRKEISGTEFTGRTFVGLESVPEALEALGARETWGKVVVKVPQQSSSKL